MQKFGVILAAGEGTRMKSTLPKVCHPLLSKPLILWAVDAVIEAGVSKPSVVLGAHADIVQKTLEDRPVDIVLQHERKGTGHALQVALKERAFKEGVLLVMYGDTPLVQAQTLASLANIIERGEAKGAVVTFSPDTADGYGRVILAEDGKIQAIVEDKDCSEQERKQYTICNAGIYAFDIQTLLSYIDKLDNNNAAGEFYITDIVSLFKAGGERFVAHHVACAEEVLGINSQAQLADAWRIAQARINNHLMAAGVTIPAPELVWVGPDVQVSPGAFLLPMTFLFGKTCVGENTTIGPNAELIDSTIGADCFVSHNTRLTRVVAKDRCSIDETVALDATLECEASAGPRAYLRPGTHLLSHAKAGTHVELKNTTVGEHSAVPHLSYIGDTEMGAYTNIGAGSITCNYNGREKNKTRIGDDCFIGSNTMMVAPVEIGDGVVTGAGSVITENVPDAALGLGRARQTNKLGYRKKSGLPYKSKQAKHR